MFILFAAAALAGAQPIVEVTGGKIGGEALPDGSAIFRSVPFAEPPVGAFRWKAPQPVKAWSGVRDATKSAPGCRQPDQGWNSYGAKNQSEDCLYVEVRTPDLKPQKPFPVMVWIHGGANVAGSGEDTVKSTIVDHGIVMVSIQYRLGVFGFMAHPALSAEAGGHSGNYALMDHQAALRWVQANIAKFGGDPANVTIFGESAGAQNVGLLMIAPGGRGLFHKAIAESGTVGFGFPPRPLAEAEAIGEALIRAAGADKADAATLRSLSGDAILKASQQRLGDLDPANMWGRATLDGAVLSEPPPESLARGGQAPVPLIIGANSKEFEMGPIAANPAEMFRNLFGAGAEGALAFYGLDRGRRPADHPRLGSVSMQVSSDIIFRCPMIVVSKAHARAGLPVWQYHFDYAPPEGPPVAHASELRYVFNAPGEQGIPKDAAPLQAYWVNFAKTGDPNGPGLPAWPRYELVGKPYLAFTVEGPKVESGLRDPVCESRPLP